MEQKYFLSVFLRDIISVQMLRSKLKVLVLFFILDNIKNKAKQVVGFFPSGGKQQQVIFAFYRPVFSRFFLTARAETC